MEEVSTSQSRASNLQFWRFANLSEKRYGENATAGKEASGAGTRGPDMERSCEPQQRPLPP